MTATVGVAVFPGTNCELDSIHAVESLGGNGKIVWHSSKNLSEVDAVIIPGGFAHGEYLRPGAIARFSPLMSAITNFANNGGPVLGICNGFQVLTESGLLPGALQKNKGLKFLCKTVEVCVETQNSTLTRHATKGAKLSLPINHFEGNFTCDHDTLNSLLEQDRVVLRYCDNPNGSINDIAGVCNEARNVVGIMPHPERACDSLLGSEDGKVLIDSLLGLN